MAARYSRLRLALPIALASVLELPAMCSAQELDPNGPPREADLKQDALGCRRPTALWPLHAATVVSCNKADSVEVTLPLKADANGYARERRVRGVYEFREYQIPPSEQDYAFDSLMNELPMAGFRIKHSIKPSTISARKDDTWILINVSGEFYNVSVVTEIEKPWTPVKSAEEISREMEARNYVAIYGIQFAPENQAIQEKGSEILNEILKYLRQNPHLAVVIESHKVSTKGNEEDDLEITRERANAVLDWLVAHGIAAGRLQSKPFGRSKPLTENDTDAEIQQNERIALAITAVPN